MLHDILYINDEQKNIAKIIFERIEKIRNGKRFVIAIGGESGSGKSVLAYCIAYEYKEHNIKAKPLHTDNYYLILPKWRTKWRIANGKNSIGINEYDWIKLNSNIQTFYEGKIAYNMPCVELLTNTVDRLTSNFKNIDILIVEGLYALKVKKADLRIFIDINYKDTMKAQEMRGKEKQTPFREIVLQREHEEVTKTKIDADIIINKSWEVITIK